jgi:2',3'-cyclic-nucleotide 2'-phosphodiesterase (5'-nucleotidase family)
MLCSLCSLPEWENFNETKNYKVLMPENLANGGEGFTMFSEFIDETLVFNELEAFLSYLQKKSPIYPAVEWRITIKHFVDPTKDVVGTTRVLLDSDCQNGECNLGNFITDAMVDWYSEKYNSSNYWTDASIAMIQGSHIGFSIDPNQTNGSIFRADVVKIFQPTPYDLHVVTLKGKQIHDVLEYSMAKFEENKNDEDFLQLSGIQVAYDLNKPAGSRIADIKIRCAECSKPQLEALDNNKNYKVIMQSIMLTQDYRDVIKSSVDVNLNETDINVFLHYAKKKSPLYPAVEERIKIVPKSETTPRPSSATKTKFSFVLILIALITYFH